MPPSHSSGEPVSLLNDRSMVVIPPPNDDGADGLSSRVVTLLLPLLNRVLQAQPTRRHLQSLMTANNNQSYGSNNSIRLIQGSRIELFCRVSGKSCAAFDWVCQRVFVLLRKQQQQNQKQKRSTIADEKPSHPPRLAAGFDCESADSIKNSILEFAVKQACRDPRIGNDSNHYNNNTRFHFDNFSLIVSHGTVDAQPVHIDLLAPNHQFGLILTDRSPLTLSYKTGPSIAPSPTNHPIPGSHIQSVADLQRQAWPDLPTPIVVTLEQNVTAVSLLQQFGDLLSPIIVPENDVVVLSSFLSSSLDSNANATPAVVPAGTLVSLPGSVMHAGPAAPSFRAVLFFTAWPKPTTTSPILPMDPKNNNNTTEDGGLDSNTPVVVPQYHPDTQYWTSLLICDIILSVWNELNTDRERIYVLTKLADAIQAPTASTTTTSGDHHPQPAQTLHRHLNNDFMIRFTKSMERKSYLHSGPKQKTNQPQSRCDCIADFAAQMGQQPVVGPIAYMDENHRFLEVLSVPNLKTTWDGQACDICIYRNSYSNDNDNIVTTRDDECSANNAVDQCTSHTTAAVIYYPSDESWEGTIPEKCYSLTLFASPNRSTPTRTTKKRNRRGVDWQTAVALSIPVFFLMEQTVCCRMKPVPSLSVSPIPVKATKQIPRRKALLQI